MAKLSMHGKSGNPTEDTVLNYLAENLPENYQVHGALRLGSSFRDFDCVVAAPHAFYVIELKAWGGYIKGNNDKWLYGDHEDAPNPMLKLSLARNRLATMLTRYYVGFRNIYVQALVGLYHESRVKLDLEMDTRYILWYKDLPKFIQDPTKISGRPAKIDLDSLAPIIEQGFSTGLFVPPEYFNPQSRVAYSVKGCVWRTNQYKAYYAVSEIPPHHHILKVYDFPSDIQPRDVHDFIHDINRERKALKVIADRGDPDSGGKEHVVVFDDAFSVRERSQYVIVMDWVDGELLSNLMQNPDRLSRHERYSIAAQICRGLAFAHSADIIHRALHPDNILRDKQGCVKLFNFNFAKFTNPPDKRWVDTMRPGNYVLQSWLDDYVHIYRYLAPEILKDTNTGDRIAQLVSANYKLATRETDLYSLGVILWELFAETMYPGQSAESLATKCNLDNEISQKIQDLCAQDPKQRQPVDLLDLAEKFEYLANGEQLDDKRSLPVFAPGDDFRGFEIVRMMATTSMSRTYEARNKYGDGRVVIKFLRAESEEAGREEMERAFTILRKLDLNYTARLIDGGETFVRNGRIHPETHQTSRIYFQIFEFVDGPTLREIIEQRNILDTPEKLLQAIRGIVAAVAAVHRVSYIHGDIKPDNFIRTPEGMIKVIDFGLSRLAGTNSTHDAGTLGYIPPERKQPREGTSSPWTEEEDVYSTTCVILALISGELDGPEGGPVVDWDEVENLGGGRFRELIENNFSPDPSRRSASAIEMLAQLDAALEELSNDQTQDAAMKNETKIREIINDLTKRAFQDNETFEKFDSAATALDKWLNQGMVGDCPVNLTEFGYSLSDPDDVDCTVEDEHSALQPTTPTITASVVSEVGDVMGQPAVIADTLDSGIGGVDYFDDKPVPEVSERPSEEAPQEAGMGEVNSNDNGEPSLSAPVGSDIPQGAKIRPVAVIPAARLTPVAPFDRDIPQEVTTRPDRVDRADLAVRLKDLVQRATKATDDAEQGGDYSVAKGLIAEIRAIDPDNEDADSLDRLIVLYERRDYLRLLKRRLQSEEDIGALDAIITEATGILHEEEYKKDPDLERLVNGATQRRDDKRSLQGQLTTVDALNDLESVQKLIQELEAARQRTERTWVDERSGSIRGIPEVMAEARQKQAALSLSAAQKLEERAHKSMPAQGVRDPVEAVELLRRALAIPGQDSSNIRRLQDILDGQEGEDGWLQQEENWKKADGLIAQADQEHDSLRRLSLARQARYTYPYHRRVLDLSEWSRAASSKFAEMLRQAIEDGETRLREAAAEAERLRRQNQSVPLQAFVNARQRVNEVKLQITDLLESDRTGDLIAQVDAAEVFLRRVQTEEARRVEIRDAYDLIRSYMDRGDKQAALSAYENLRTDFKGDPEIRFLREQMEKFFDVEDLVREARRQRKDHLWADCLETCKKFDAKPEDSRKKFESEISRIRAEARLQILCDEINQRWEENYFNRAAEKIREFDNQAYEPLEGEENLKTRLEQSLELASRRDELHRRQAVDIQFNVRKRLEEQQQELQRILQQFEKVKNAGDKAGTPEKLIGRALSAHDNLKRLREYDSSYYGEARDAFARARALLHEILVHELNRQRLLEQDQSNALEFNYDVAYERANQLSEKQVAYPEDASLRRWALIKYYDQQERRADPEQRVRNWQDAYGQIPEPAFRERLRIAQKAYLLRELDRKLRDNDYESALMLLKGEEQLELFDPPYHFRYDEDRDLELRWQLANVQRGNADLWNQENYYQVVIGYDSLLKELGADQKQDDDRTDFVELVKKQREGLVKEAVQLLLSAGGQAVGKGDISLAVGKFAAALQIKPDDLAARTAIETHKGAVLIEVESALKELRDAEVGEQNLDGKIEELSALEVRLRSLAAACRQLQQTEKADRIISQLEGGTENLLTKIRKLKQCRRWAEEIRADGAVWKTKCLAQGDFEYAEDILEKLTEELDSRHEVVVELRHRIEKHRAEREALEKLREKLRGEFSNDQFQDGLETCNKIDQALHLSILEQGGDLNQYPPRDPYGLVGPDWTIYDRLLRDAVRYFSVAASKELQGGISSGERTVRALLEARKENIDPWKRFQVKLKREYEDLVSDSSEYDSRRPTRDDPPTRKQLDDINKYIDRCILFEATYEELKSLPDPLSLACQAVQGDCQRMLDRIVSERGEAERDRDTIEDYEVEVQAKIDLAVKYLENNQDTEALINLRDAKDYYEDVQGNPNNDFIDHLVRILG